MMNQFYFLLYFLIYFGRAAAWQHGATRSSPLPALGARFGAWASIALAIRFIFGFYSCY